MYTAVSKPRHYTFLYTFEFCEEFCEEAWNILFCIQENRNRSWEDTNSCVLTENLYTIFISCLSRATIRQVVVVNNSNALLFRHNKIRSQPYKTVGFIARDTKIDAGGCCASNIQNLRYISDDPIFAMEMKEYIPPLPLFFANYHVEIPILLLCVRSRMLLNVFFIEWNLLQFIRISIYIYYIFKWQLGFYEYKDFRIPPILKCKTRKRSKNENKYLNVKYKLRKKKFLNLVIRYSLKITCNYLNQCM